MSMMRVCTPKLCRVVTSFSALERSSSCRFSSLGFSISLRISIGGGMYGGSSGSSGSGWSAEWETPSRLMPWALISSGETSMISWVVCLRSGVGSRSSTSGSSSRWILSGSKEAAGSSGSSSGTSSGAEACGSGISSTAGCGSGCSKCSPKWKSSGAIRPSSSTSGLSSQERPVCCTSPRFSSNSFMVRCACCESATGRTGGMGMFDFKVCSTVWSSLAREGLPEATRLIKSSR